MQGVYPVDRPCRRRVWWVVFIFDAGAAVTFGRPIVGVSRSGERCVDIQLLPSAEADVHPVLNTWDRTFPPSATIVPVPSTDPTMYSSLIQQALFHDTGNKCYNRVISSPAPSSAEALLLDYRLRQWHDQLPSYLQVHGTAAGQTPPWLIFSAQKLFWRYCNLRVIIGRRAFLERALNGSPISQVEETDTQSAAICLEAALDTILAISHFCTVHLANRLERWYEL